MLIRIKRGWELPERLATAPTPVVSGPSHPTPVLLVPPGGTYIQFE